MPEPENLNIQTVQGLSLTIHASNAREIVRITPEGKVIINPEFTLDEAARAFWRAVQQVADESRKPTENSNA